MTTQAYTLDELCESHQLSASEGRRIIKLCGPARADIDAFMIAFRNRRSVESWALNPTAARQPHP